MVVPNIALIQLVKVVLRNSRKVKVRFAMIAATFFDTSFTASL
jgi:hypothetical protein